jgi:hypothetical protein
VCKIGERDIEIYLFGAEVLADSKFKPSGWGVVKVPFVVYTVMFKGDFCILMKIS